MTTAADHCTWLSDAGVGHEGYVSSLVASPEGRFFASSSFDGTVIVWDARQGTIVHEWVAHSGSPVFCLAFSPDGCHLLSAGDDRVVKFWDLSDNARQVYALKREVDEESVSTGEVLDVHNGCALSPDGMWIASTSLGLTLMVHLWQRDAREGNFRRCRSFDRLAASPRFRGPGACFSPDSRWLVWPAEVSGITRVCVWDALDPDGSPRTFAALPDNDSSPPNALSFNPTGDRLLTAHDRRLCVWNTIAGELLAVMEGHEGLITSGCFSPDGQTVLSASEDGTAKVWEVGSGTCLSSLEGHGRGVVQALYSPDGEYVATASKDGTLRLWKTRDRSCLVTSTGHRSPLSHIALSPDGETIAAADVEGVVWVHDVSCVLRIVKME